MKEVINNMELKDFMKEVSSTLGKYKVEDVSFTVGLAAENDKVDVAPFGTRLEFEMKVDKEEKKK